MKSNNISIGILDLYTAQDLNNCIDSIPEELKSQIFIVSNTSNKIPNSISNFRYTGEVALSSLYNHLISHFRKNKTSHYFIINSNLAFLEKDFFEKTIKRASVFGTWFITGPSSTSLPVEDEDHKITMDFSPELNTSFMYIFSGIIKNNGYFEEHYMNDDNLCVLDYCYKLRKLGVYPPFPFNPIINDGLYKSNSESNKKNFYNKEKRNELSYGFFYFKHKYLPGHDDPKGCSQVQLFEELEKIQKKYSKI